LPFIEGQNQRVYRLNQFRLSLLRFLCQRPSTSGPPGLAGLVVLLNRSDLLVLGTVVPIIALTANRNRFSMLAFTLGTKNIFGLIADFSLPAWYCDVVAFCLRPYRVGLN
jgi:hypothetical protein